MTSTGASAVVRLLLPDQPVTVKRANETTTNTNKQQTTSKADPLPNSVLKVVSPYPCHRIEPLPGVDSRISR